MGTVSGHVGPGPFVGYTLIISGVSPGVSPGVLDYSSTILLLQILSVKQRDSW